MELKQHISEILKYIESKGEYLEMSQEMFEVLEGDIYTKLVSALKTQILSDAAFKSAVQRIPPINIMKRIATKLTQIYTTNPKRTATVDGEASDAYQEVIEYYERIFNIDTKFNDVDFFGNSIRYSSVETYVDDNNMPKLRVNPSHKFLVWSSSLIEPNIPDVFIKLMGQINKGTRKVNVYWLYTDDEFIIVDAEGAIVSEEEVGAGVRPQTYFNDSSYMLMPFHEIDLFKMSILIPLLYTDMNDAVRYMAYSVIYTLDADSSNFERNPNVIIDLKSDDVNKTPSIGTLEPKVDIPNVIELIKTQMADWLETKGLKGGGGSASVAGNASGISLMIQEIDTTQRLKDRIVRFTEFESDFWERMIFIHNAWVANGTVKELPMLPLNLKVITEFELPKPIEEENDRLERATIAKKEGLATTKDALMIWKPKLTSDEAEALALELDTVPVIEVEDNGEQELQ